MKMYVGPHPLALDLGITEIVTMLFEVGDLENATTIAQMFSNILKGPVIVRIQPDGPMIVMDGDQTEIVEKYHSVTKIQSVKKVTTLEVNE